MQLWSWSAISFSPYDFWESGESRAIEVARDKGEEREEGDKKEKEEKKTKLKRHWIRTDKWMAWRCVPFSCRICLWIYEIDCIFPFARLFRSRHVEHTLFFAVPIAPSFDCVKYIFVRGENNMIREKMNRCSCSHIM